MQNSYHVLTYFVGGSRGGYYWIELSPHGRKTIYQCCQNENLQNAEQTAKYFRQVIQFFLPHVS